MNLKLPKGVYVCGMKLDLTQDEDCCGRSNEEAQDMEVEFHDGGGGFYFTIKTDRWAIDEDTMVLWKTLYGICEELDNKSIFSDTKEN